MKSKSRITYSLDIHERLLERIQIACDVEGWNVNTFMETALHEAVGSAERRSTNVQRALRDADDFPFPCGFCDRRFKLPMHLGNHMKASHPDDYEKWSRETETEPAPEVVDDPDLVDEPEAPVRVDLSQLDEPDYEPGSEPGHEDDIGGEAIDYEVDEAGVVTGSVTEFKLGVDPDLIEMDEPKLPALGYDPADVPVL